MAHLLRRTISNRMKSLMLETNKHDFRNNTLSWQRLFASGIPTKEDERKFQTPVSLDESYLTDLKKFGNDDKISLPLSHEKQENYAIGASNDVDTFGTLADSNPYLLKHSEGTKGDEIEEKYTSELPNYLEQKKYVAMIRKYLRQRRFADALDVLQVKMLKEHRVQPEYYVYSILISYCGYTGYTKMAFKLFTDMKRRSLSVKPSVYTALFNCCANSPFPSDGLTRTRKLLTEMNEKGIIPNLITCHAIIKAFGRCGSVEEAFQFVDFMMTNKMELKPEAISFLFQACISDKEAGFRHALLVYRKMIQYRIKPHVIHYNLLLRCIRDCGMGDLTSTIDVLQRLGVKDVGRLTAEKVNQPTLDAGYAWDEDENLTNSVVSGSSPNIQAPSNSSTSFSTDNPESLLPNLFASSPTLGCVVSLSEMTTSHDRLLLLGGLEGFLKEMSDHGVHTDVKTLCLLLECCPNTCSAEENLIALSGKLKISLDLLFFNTLMIRRVHRKQYSEAKEVLTFISARGLKPDMMTYVNLGLACENISEAYDLLKAIDQSGFRPNVELLTALLGSASKRFQIKYVDLILDVIDYEEIEVNQRFLVKMEKFHGYCQQVMKNAPRTFSPQHLAAIKKFCEKYPTWLKTVRREEEKHPWQHLRERYPTESDTDKEFLNNHVENDVIKPAFPRLGPNTSPKVRAAKIKKMKEENPEAFQKKVKVRSTWVKNLEGLDSVQYQEIVSHQNKK